MNDTAIPNETQHPGMSESPPEPREKAPPEMEMSLDDAFDEEGDDVQAARWRRAVLALSDNLRGAADERPEFSGVLMEALHHALEQLLIYGDAEALLSLEEWLELENSIKAEAGERVSLAEARDDRRKDDDRRSGAERRRSIGRRLGVGRRGEERGICYLQAWVRRSPSGRWLAEAPEFPGCACDGDSRVEALQLLQEAVKTRLQAEVAQRGMTGLDEITVTIAAIHEA